MAAPILKQWSLSGQFQDFSRGVLTSSAAAYYLLIVATMLYLSMVLIGRRHWRSGSQRLSMVLHYTVRLFCLAVVAVSLCLVLRWRDARWDVTSERLSSLSPQTEKLLAELKLDRPVQIEAFISPTVPEGYVQTRLNLLSALREIASPRPAPRSTCRSTTQSGSATRPAGAEKLFGITARRVESFEHGARSAESIFMGVAMKSGPQQKVVVPFIDRGVPIEYELVRSLCTVAQQKRKRIGVLGTDAPLYGTINFQTM